MNEELKQTLSVILFLVVKTRFQLQVGTGGADGYSSMGDCIKKIIKNEG